MKAGAQSLPEKVLQDHALRAKGLGATEAWESEESMCASRVNGVGEMMYVVDGLVAILVSTTFNNTTF